MVGGAHPERRCRRARIPSDRLLTVSLDEFLLIGRRALRPFCRFARIYPQPKMKRFSAAA